MPSLIDQADGFDWTDEIVDKLIRKHNVQTDEVEECFEHAGYVIRRIQDNLYYLYGQAQSGRYLFVVYVWRRRFIRVISARDMTQQERRYYKRK